MSQPIGSEGWSGRRAPSDMMFIGASTVGGGVLASPALTNWAIEETAKRTVANLGTLAHMDPFEAKDWIESCRWESDPGQLTAAQAGTFLHEVLECWMHGEAAPPVAPGLEAQLQPRIDRLAEWMRANRPELVSSEIPVYNFAAQVAGRFDLVCRFTAGTLANEHGTDQRWLLDMKNKESATTKRGYDHKPYADSVALQLAAYRWASHYATFPPRTVGADGKQKYIYGGRTYLLNQSEIDQLGETRNLWGCTSEELLTAVLMVTPAWARTFPVDTGPDVLEAVKSVRNAWEWRYFGSKDRIKGYVS